MLVRFAAFAALIALCAAPTAFAQDAAKPPTMEEMKTALDAATTSLAELKTNSKVAADTLWVMITGMLVFFMNLGFACVESGFCRAKNCVNILSKNFVVFAATTIGFWFIGWGLMFGNGSPWVGSDGLLMVSGADASPNMGTLATLVKADVKDQFKLDLDDKEVAAKHEDLLKKIDEISGEATSKVTAAKKKVKNKEGKEDEVENTFAVKLDVPGKGVLEKDYGVSGFYWGAYPSLNWTGVPLWAKFFFQLVFAGTAATIVSGAVAERIKYHSFIIFSFIMAILIYPIVGHWVWGGGVLQSMGFLDFAGSTQVHSIGGWAALVGIIVLGPRIGKYGPDGKVNAIPGHNLTAATIGCFVLWFGWFGFNPGSTMAADAKAMAHVAVTTNLAACAATLTATVTAWVLLGKPDLGMTLNGCLAGLVAITAPCAFVTPGVSLAIGAVSGVMVVFAVQFFDKLKLDDPVGATSVHLVHGVFGTICVGLFAHPDLTPAANASGNTGLFYGGGTGMLMVQLIGVAYTAGYVLVVSTVGWLLLKYTIGIRVSAEEEIEGLDIGEHGNEAYYGFVLNKSVAHVTNLEPKAALVPRTVKRYAIAIDGVEPAELMKTWSELCLPKGADNATFKEVYANFTTVQGTTFHFSGGEPQKMASNLEKIFNGKLKGKAAVKVR